MTWNCTHSCDIKQLYFEIYKNYIKLFKKFHLNYKYVTVVKCTISLIILFQLIGHSQRFQGYFNRNKCRVVITLVKPDIRLSICNFKGFSWLNSLNIIDAVIFNDLMIKINIDVFLCITNRPKVQVCYILEALWHRIRLKH